jgi:alkylation response protein AidB-like acyl-CoA dehydrogenase
MTAPELMRRAHEVAAVLARGAVERDRLRVGAEHELVELKSAGLLQVTVAPALGGVGLKWSDALRALRLIAGVDNPTAMLLGYHWVVFRTTEMIGAFDDALRSCAVDGGYLAGVTNARDAPLVLRPVGEAYRLEGRKTFCTGARVADLLMVSASLDGAPATVLIPADRRGIRALRDWDSFGERSSESGSVEFSDVEVRADELFVPEVASPAVASPQQTLSAPLIQLLFVNLYIGAAEGALADAIAYARTSTRPWPTAGVSRLEDDPYVLEGLGQMTAELRAARALADEVGHVMDAALAHGAALSHEERGETAISVYAAKIQASRVALAITERVFEVMGARSTSERYGFDRRWRDVRVHTLHDPIAYKAREVGAHVLSGVLPAPSNYS